MTLVPWSLSWSRAVRASFVPALVAASLVSCSRGGAGVRGSGTIKTETRSVSGFNHIVVAGEADVAITQNGTESLTIEADDNLLPLLTSSVTGSNLELGTTGSIRPSKRIHYTITVKDFTGFDLSGSGNVTATQIDATAIKVLVSGAGNARVSGKTQSQDVTISGAGGYESPQLASKSAKVTLSGAGNALVAVSDTLDANISGVGNLEYVGDPKVTKNVSGVGGVRKH